uniref:Uncharacterized protein n=1 Tax=Salmonella phage vB_SEnST11_KE23 TaxID=3161174 RepID=A0AAU8GEJ1_9CAUD
MKITDDPIKAIEGTVGDITITGTGVYSPSHRTVSISQPNGTRPDDEDFILMCDVSDLPRLIAALQQVQDAYNKHPVCDEGRSEEYRRGWDDSIKHHTGPVPDGGYRGPYGNKDVSDYQEGWNDAWDFL